VVLTAVLLATFVLAPAVTTAVGARRRGLGGPAALLAGLAFPVTWIAWYLRDERPWHRRRAGCHGRVEQAARPAS
jgi:hypothetical protein